MSDHLEHAILNAYKVHQSYNDHSEERMLTDEMVRELRHLQAPRSELVKARIRLWKSGHLVLRHKLNHGRKLKGHNILDGSGYRYAGE